MDLNDCTISNRKGLIGSNDIVQLLLVLLVLVVFSNPHCSLGVSKSFLQRAHAPLARFAIAPGRFAIARLRKNWFYGCISSTSTCLDLISLSFTMADTRALSSGRRRRREEEEEERQEGDGAFEIREDDFIFRVTLEQSARWRVFRTDRRLYRVRFSSGGSTSHLLANLRVSRLLAKVLFSLLRDIRTHHLDHGRPREALLFLSLRADELDYPINSSAGPLFGGQTSDDVALDLLEKLAHALTSKQSLNLDRGFEIQAIVVDDTDPRLIWSVSGGGRPALYRGERMWDFCPPAKWDRQGHLSGKKFLKAAPLMCGDPVFKDCCLLASIAICLSYNAHMRRCRLLRLKLPCEPEGSWKTIQRLNESNEARRRFAHKALRSDMEMLVLQTGLDVSVFQNYQFGDDRLRHEVDKLNIRLSILKDSEACRAIFSHPMVYKGDREPVTVLAVALFDKSPEESLGITHAVSVLSPESLSSYTLGVNARCTFCDKYFSREYLHTHHCPSIPKCKKCKMPLLPPNAYLDERVEKHYCEGRVGENTRCEKCEKYFDSKRCFTAHKKFCKDTSARCEECGSFYKVKKGEKQSVARRRHKCNQMYCRTCRKMVSVHTAGNRHGTHNCVMAKPALQLKIEKLAVYDTETRLDQNGEHKVNALGMSFETGRGVFSEVYFYDDRMDHPEDGREVAACLNTKYWPDGTDVAFLQPGRRKKAVMNSLMIETSTCESVFEEGVEELLGNDEETAEVENDTMFDSEARETRHLSDDDNERSYKAPKRKLRRFLTVRERQEEEEEDEVEEEENGRTALDKFLDFILCPEFYGYVFLAHAGSRFDSILILNALKSRKVRVEVLMDGQKLLHLKVVSLKIRFIDSYRYIKLPLDGFVKRFPQLLDGGAAEGKGLFPFKMNRPDNYEYDGCFPPKDEFVDEFSSRKSVKKYEEFRESWPSEKRWVLKHELHKYLVQDVRTLRGGVLAFIEEFYTFQMDLNASCGADTPILFHPFASPFFTKSAFVHAVWQHHEMKEEDLYLLQNQRNARKTSRLEMEWLLWMQHSQGVSIQTQFTHSSGQAKLGPYYPDGLELLAGGERRVYEFNGCAVHFHAGEKSDCPSSRQFLPGDKNPFGLRCDLALSAWKKKKEYYASLLGVTVVVMWECEFLKLKEQDVSLREFLNTSMAGRPNERLRIRTGLRGGRVEAFRLAFHQRRMEDRKLLYVDKNSLYPAVAVFNEFPVGMPSCLIGTALENVHFGSGGFYKDGERLTGLVQASVLAPDSLFLPLLPFVSKNKLKFGLCFTCVETENSDLCLHSDEKRAFTDVWTTVELEYAMECGYQIINLWEMHVYTKTSPIFRRFYTRLARIKLESEGFPFGVNTEEAKETYVKDMNRQMPGLSLESKNVKRNEPRRQFAKDTSNIGLGKFSQNDLRRNSKYVTSFEEYAKMKFENPRVKITSLSPLDEHYAEVSYEPVDSLMGYHRNTHVVVYSFVTAYARVGMMRDMRKLMELGGRLFYTDTDSVIFDFPISGDFEALEREFNMGSKAYNAYKYETEQPIHSFATLGAKNYSLQLADTLESIVKSRGFTLTSDKAMSILNYYTMYSMVEDFRQGVETFVVSENFQMKLDKRTATVKNGKSIKRYGNRVFDKRFFPHAGHLRDDEDNDSSTVCSLPFGIKHTNFSDACRDTCF